MSSLLQYLNMRKVNLLSIEDQQVIEAAIAGDKIALETILIKYQKDIQRFAKRTCQTSEDAEDAVQVVLWQLHQKIQTLRVVPALISWLFKSVERECRRLLRLRQRTVSLEDNYIEQIAPQTHEDLHYDLINSLQKLPVLYRQIIILRDIQEMTTIETANLLDLPVSTIKIRLHRARHMLRAILIKAGHQLND